MTEWIYFAVVNGRAPHEWRPFRRSIPALHTAVVDWADEERDNPEIRLSIMYKQIPPIAEEDTRRICGIILAVDDKELPWRLKRFSETCAAIKRARPAYLNSMGLTIVIIPGAASRKSITDAREKAYTNASMTLQLPPAMVSLQEVTTEESLEDVLRNSIRSALLKEQFAQLLQE